MNSKSSIGSRIIHGTLVIAFMSLAAKLASYITEATLASYLGTSWQGDAYYMVAGVKDLIYPMLSVGIWKVFLPLYKERVALNDASGASSLANKTTTLFTLASALIVIVVMVFAVPIVSLIAPGFEGVTKNLCVKLVRISAPSYVLIIASAVYASMLQCHNQFFGSQVRELASHVPVIISAVVFYRYYGIEALAFGIVVSGAVRLAIELPFVDWGYRYRFDFDFHDNSFNTMLKRLPSSLVSEGVVQLNTLVDKAMASTLPDGTISALNYAHKLTNVFSGLLSTAITTALYPQMVELIALGKDRSLRNLLSRIISLFCLVMIPVSFACVLYRYELVAIAFQRGSFGENSVLATSGVFALYSSGMLFVACNTVINNVFYGYGDTLTPMRASVLTLLLNAFGNLAFMPIWGAEGFALSTTLSNVITLLARLVLLKRYICLEWSPLLSSIVRILLSSLCSCIIPRLLIMRFAMSNIATLVFSAIIGVLLYYIFLRVFRVEEVDELIRLISKRV